MNKTKKQSEKNIGLATHLKQFGLKVDDLVIESGRSRDSLNAWFSRDKTMISALIKAAITTRYSKNLKVLETQDSNK